jgi:hypothetical protein
VERRDRPPRFGFAERGETVALHGSVLKQGIDEGLRFWSEGGVPNAEGALPAVLVYERQEGGG